MGASNSAQHQTQEFGIHRTLTCSCRFRPGGLQQALEKPICLLGGLPAPAACSEESVGLSCAYEQVLHRLKTTSDCEEFELRVQLLPSGGWVGRECWETRHKKDIEASPLGDVTAELFSVQIKP